jgi:hypothetical protein
VSDTETTSWIAALERARAELESALEADAHGRALRRAGAETGRTAHEQQALAENPVYRCWQQLNGAIEEQRRKVQSGAQAGPAPARSRIALREILERIRSDPALEDALQDAGPQAAASEPECPEPARAAASGAEPASTPGPGGLATPAEGRPDSVPMEVEPEEATVSFVIREPARPAPAAGRSGEPSGPKEPAPPETAEPDLGVEAEVIIVPRRR